MHLKLNGIEMICTGAETWGDLLKSLPDGGANALGISILGRTCALNDRVEEYVFANTVTYDDEEGRRIYERSMQFVFLAAANRVFPGARVHISHTYINGLYIAMPGIEVTQDAVDAVKREMRSIVEQDLPITRFEVTTEAARAYYASVGRSDCERVLAHRAQPTFTMFELDGLKDNFYGVMATHTGLLHVFDLCACGDGFRLQMPGKDASAPAKFIDQPQLLRTYIWSAEWHKILDVENVADLGDMVRDHRMREFIRVNEALQERRVEQIVEQFLASGARVLLVAGPSSSGKTTFSHRLSIGLRVHGKHPVKVSLDDYYIDRDRLPREPDGTIDLERIDTLDLELLGEHLTRLLAGETVDLPTYDFKTGRRAQATHPLTVAPGEPIIIEGIHGLNDRLTASVPAELKFKVFISALTMINLDDHNRIRTTDARLLRRIVRDYKFRGTSPEETIAMWPSVRRGEINYIFPFQEQADAIFNSALTYELCILKHYAYPALQAVPPESPYYTQARRLVKFLNYIEPADVEDEVPVNSILREFIGGSCFYREED